MQLCVERIPNTQVGNAKKCVSFSVAATLLFMKRTVVNVPIYFAPEWLMHWWAVFELLFFDSFAQSYHWRWTCTQLLSTKSSLSNSFQFFFGQGENVFFSPGDSNCQNYMEQYFSGRCRLCELDTRASGGFFPFRNSMLLKKPSKCTPKVLRQELKLKCARK